MDKELRNQIKKIKSEFAKVYSTEIKPQMLEFENLRKNKLTKIILIECLLVILAGFSLFLGYSSYSTLQTISNFMMNCIFFTLAFIVIGIFYIYNENKKFSKELKSHFKSNILKGFRQISKIYWSTTPTINKTELQMSGLFSNFDDMEKDDCFKGIYKETAYAIQECILTQNKSVFWIAFKGVVVKFSSNKNFKGNTIISTKQDFNIRNIDIGTLIYSIPLLGLGIYLTWIIGARFIEELTIYGNTDTSILLIGLELLAIPIIAIACIVWIYKNRLFLKKTELEDIEFEKKYNVQTTDEIEARYLLTPSFMERLKNIQTAFKTNNIKCAFSNESIILAISTNKNIFEIGNLLTPLDDAKTLDIFFNELTSLLILIDYFKLNEHTGL